MIICEKKKCTGCGACVSLCPTQCVSLVEDELGAPKWSVDERRCSCCGLCVKSCPNNASLSFHRPIGCYAAYITDRKKRGKCASGGIGSCIGEYVIQAKNGVVFGTAYDDKMEARTTWTECVDGVERFKGSKYVQSIVDGCVYSQAKAFLDDDRYVVYISTPCQIAGLKAYLRQDYEKLITVDLICHGVSPTKYFAEERDRMVKKFCIGGLDDVRFRDNEGNGYRMTLWAGKKKYDAGGIDENYYLAGFIYGVSLRDNCFDCPYARPERVSDITIGDFIGLGSKVPFVPKENNVSCVLVNTDRGAAFYHELVATHEVESYERTYEERLAYRPSLAEPFKKHPLNWLFCKLYPKLGFTRSIRIAMGCFLLCRRVRNFVCSISRRIFRKIMRCLCCMTCSGVRT